MVENNLGLLLRDERKRRGLTQSALEDYLMISIDYISKIEKGLRVPSKIVESKIYEFLGGGGPGVSEPPPQYMVTTFHASDLRPDQAELLRYYEQMCEDQRTMFIGMARGFIEDSKQHAKKGGSGGGSKASNCA